MNDAIKRLFDRFLRKSKRHAGQNPMDSTGMLADDEEAYTVFEGTGLRLEELADDLPEGSHQDPGGIFRIRLAESHSSRRHAGMLVMRRYSFRGYRTKSVQTDPRLFTFVAYDLGRLVGTVSLRFDSKERLAADDLYRPELDSFRQQGIRLCEFTRLAVDVSVGSKRVLAALFHTAYLLAHRIQYCDGAIIEVNPRHVVFYRRALAFEPVGPERMSPRVNAPAVLLYVPFSRIAEGLAKYAGRPDLAGSTHFLFPYGFSSVEEIGILGRLKALGDSQHG